jgi:hypothetical protein
MKKENFSFILIMSLQDIFPNKIVEFINKNTNNKKFEVFNIK